MARVTRIKSLTDINRQIERIRSNASALTARYAGNGMSSYYDARTNLARQWKAEDIAQRYADNIRNSKMYNQLLDRLAKSPGRADFTQADNLKVPRNVYMGTSNG